jgi:hypothetical protein
MVRFGSRWPIGAIALLLGSGLGGCGTADGVRYTVDGEATFTGTAAPPTDTTIRLFSVWSYAGGMSLDSGGPGKATIASPDTAIGPWASTADPHVFTFKAVVEVARPDHGDAPEVADGVTIQRSDHSAYGNTTGQHVGDEEDGWYSAQMTVSFDCTLWQ